MNGRALRALAVLGSAVFLVAVPGTVALLAPRWISGWRTGLRGPWWLPVQMAGALLAAAGAVVLVDSIARFAWQGLGTPAPVFPTRRLVVTGLYRYVRNPMYVAVVSMIAGQGLALGNALVLGYAAAVWLAFHVFVVGYEERALRRAFGEEYERFRAAVPRWIPRLTPCRRP